MESDSDVWFDLYGFVVEGVDAAMTKISNNSVAVKDAIMKGSEKMPKSVLESLNTTLTDLDQLRCKLIK